VKLNHNEETRIARRVQLSRYFNEVQVVRTRNASLAA